MCVVPLSPVHKDRPESKRHPVLLSSFRRKERIIFARLGRTRQHVHPTLHLKTGDYRLCNTVVGVGRGFVGTLKGGVR